MICTRAGHHLLTLVLLVVTLCLPASLLAQENRLALVIGNSDYNESPLDNPENDARDMADTLENLGFTVILRIDADRGEMSRAIRDFGRQLKEQRGVGLFYYAGHGMQIDNRNFLIPVDSALEEEDEVPFESVDVGSILAKMESAGNALNLLILDACRNNPFPSNFRGSNRGLARVEAPIGSLVVYSTAPGDVAADGDGRNGVFTGALLQELRTPGLSLTQTIRRTRAAVVKATEGRQVPWESSSLLQDYYLAGEPGDASGSSDTADGQSGDAAQIETADSDPSNMTKSDKQPDESVQIDPDLLFWTSINQSQSAAEYRAYLERFPDGLFAPLARTRLEQIGRSTKDLDDVVMLPEKHAAPTATTGAPTLAQKTPAGRPEPAADTSTIETAADRTGQLIVNTTPDDARVRIMNIVEKYEPGMALALNRSYDILVTRTGYQAFREEVELKEEKLALSVSLQPITPLVPETISLPGGTYSMGCSRQDSRCESYEKPRHSVTVPAFSMARTEVTVAQFAQFVENTGYRTDAEKDAGGLSGCYIWMDNGGISRAAARWDWVKDKNWRDPGYPQKPDYPVSCVSWNDAMAYARWLGDTEGRQFALPTEAQWEYAARAGENEHAYVNGSDPQGLCSHANIADTSLSPSGSKWSARIACNDRYWFSAPVSSYKPNAHGLYDMQGNVWEWVLDHWADGFDNTPQDGKANLAGATRERVLRGGAWESDASRSRLSSRNRAKRYSRTAMTGFRLVSP